MTSGEKLVIVSYFCLILETIKNINLEMDSDLLRNADKALRESQRFLSTLISNLPGYVYRVQKVAKDWKMQFVSEGIYEMTGYQVSDFLNDGKIFFSGLVIPEDKSVDKDIVLEALKNKKPYQITYRIITKEGKIKWVWEQGRGVYSEEGDLIATEGFISDITEKKIAEEEILKRNRELATLNFIGQSLSKLVKPEEIFELIFIMIGQLFDTQNLYIALFNEDENQIYFPIYTVEGKRIEHARRSFNKGLTEFVIKSKKPLLIKNEIENVFENLGIEQLGKKSRSLLSVPIILGDKVFGVITIQDYVRENVFTENQLELLQTVAYQTAIAFENAKLFSALQMELEEKNKTEIKLKSSLREKELLLQEVHHRVKNNLQIMSSLLRLQSSNIKNINIQNIFLESENRIKAMAIVHNKLYDSHSYDKIDFADYVKTLVTNLFISLTINSNIISYELNIKDTLLNIDTAVPLGLIINELISNSLKHAFPNNRPGKISISLEKNKEENILRVQDNGIGIIDKDLHDTKGTLGMKLVNLLTSQIDGRITSSFVNGAKFSIYFKELQYKQRT